MAIKLNMGQLIDKLHTIREKRRALSKQDDELKTEYDTFEQMLLDKMKAEGCERSAGKTASASISSNLVYNVKDWDAFTAFVYKKKCAHLFQRRVSNAAVDEMFRLNPKGGVPGVEAFNKEGINLRNL